MAFKPLSKILIGAASPLADVGALSQAVSEAKRLRSELNASLPHAFHAEVISVSVRNRALMIAVRNHGSATKLYQFQQSVLAHFAAKDLNFKEIRVFVQPPSEQASPVAPKPTLPGAAVPALSRAIAATTNEELRAALTRLRAHAKP